MAFLLSTFLACELSRDPTDHKDTLSGHKSRKPYARARYFSFCTYLSDVNTYPTSVTLAVMVSTVLKLPSFLQFPTRSLNSLTLPLSSLPMGTGRLGRLLKTMSESKSAAEVSRQIASPSKPKAVLRLRIKSKGKAPATAAESPLRPRRPSLGIDTRPLSAFGSRQSYGTIGDQQSIYGGPSVLNCRSPETYRNGHLLFNVPEEVDDDELEVLLEEDGLYLGSL